MTDRFDASVKRGHQQTLSNVIGRVFQGQTFALTAAEQKDLGDLAGNLNYYASLAPVGAVEIIPYQRNDPDGSGSCLFWASPGVSYAVEIPIPAGTATAGGGIAAIPSGGIPIEGKFSTVAGDFDGAATGPNPSYSVPNPPAGTYYFNVRLALGWSQQAHLRLFCNPTPP